jgi:hypothetical protein
MEIISNGHVNDKPAGLIRDLTDLILARLAEIAGPKLRPKDQDGDDTSGAAWKSIVILGEPTGVAPPDIVAERDSLQHVLRASKVGLATVSDNWDNDPAPNCQSTIQLLSTNSVFIQPLGPGEASLIAKQPGIQRDRMKDLVGQDSTSAKKVDACRVVLWLPRKFTNRHFAEAKDTPPTFFSSETPQDLAARIIGRSKIRPRVPVIMLEDLSKNPDLQELLEKEFRRVVEQKVEPPLERYDFLPKSKDLERQMRGVVGERAILAIHDLSVGPARDSIEARELLDNRLKSFRDEVASAQKASGRGDIKLFWSTLVVRNPEHFPYVRHPAPEFKDWHLLTFEEDDQNELRAEPTQAVMFLNHLDHWVHS